MLVKLWISLALAAGACAGGTRTCVAQLPTSGVMLIPERISKVDTLKLQPYNTPLIYRQWFDEISACTGLTAPSGLFERIQWFGVPGDAFWIHGSGPFLGWTDVDHTRIFVLAKYIGNERLIKHETVHMLMHAHNLEAGHPAEYFDKCEVAS